MFISLQKNSDKDISRDTISRWLVSVIKSALVKATDDKHLRSLSNVTAHQVRAMATSWAAFSGAKVDEVRKAAFWRGHTTFSSFYLRDLTSQVEEISALCPLVAASRLCQGDKFLDTEDPEF